MDWEQRDRAPSRNEADRDAREEWLIETYEERFLDWCLTHQRDPETVASAVEYEEWWWNVEEE